jgi:hypothetical protein
MMARDQVVVPEHNSVQVKLGGLIISALRTTSDSVDVVVGRPGLPNIEKTLRTGGAVLFETPDDGLFEVRLLAGSVNQAKLLISHISPSPGIAGGFVDQDHSNSPFTAAELARIADSLQRIRLALSERPDVTPEQLDFISRKLSEMQGASERLGRKDWMNLAVGTLTSIIVTAALDRGVGKALLQAAGTALSWLFQMPLQLLP